VQGCNVLNFYSLFFQAVEFVEASIDHINAYSKNLRRLFLVEDIVDSIKVYFLICHFDIDSRLYSEFEKLMSRLCFRHYSMNNLKPHVKTILKSGHPVDAWIVVLLSPE